MPAGRSMYTGGTTSKGPVIAAASTPIVDPNAYRYDIALSANNDIPSVSGIYTGSLSSMGNFVAMALNEGGYQQVYVGRDPETNSDVYTSVPWLTGYMREYWKTPSSCTFGANSAIPAITGVMPSSYSDTPGNLLYYIDLQLCRMSGSNFFNNFSFINAFNQVLAWVQSANDYLLAVKKAEETNLSYYGYTNYSEFVTNGFSRYANGNALRLALINIGSMLTEVSTGYFGTPNSVAKKLVNSGVGMLGNLTAQLSAAGIPLDDGIYNEVYTIPIQGILETITDPGDLSTIQTVLESSIPNMRNPLDYADISFASGLQNDSSFKTFYDFGKDLFQRAPGLPLKTGLGLVLIIELVLSNTGTAVDKLATPTSILPQAIIDGLRQFLPESKTKGPISILNVIGTPAGAWLEQLTQVNQAIDELAKTPYGPQIRTALRTVDTTYKAYKTAAYTVTDSEGGGYIVIPPAVIAAFEAAKTTYLNLMTTISADLAMQGIVKKINSNYDAIAEHVYYEIKNYNKANIKPSTFTDNSQIYSFVSSLPSYAANGQGLGTDYLLYNMCQDNDAGQIVKTILNQYKNNQALSLAGVTINNII